MASMSSSLPAGLGRLLPGRMSTVATSKPSQFYLSMSRLAIPLLPTISLSIPAAIQLNIPSFLPGLWDSILRAVPKKKTSHMKKRHRQMAGKALKDVTALNKCPACGNIKRAHLLCPYCVDALKKFMKTEDRKQEAKATRKTARLEEMATSGDQARSAESS